MEKEDEDELMDIEDWGKYLQDENEEFSITENVVSSLVHWFLLTLINSNMKVRISAEGCGSNDPG